MSRPWRHPFFLLAIWSAGAFLHSSLLSAQLSPAELEDIGFTDLQTLLGGSAPTGQGVSVTQVEATESGSYRPNVADFTGKAFSFPSGGNVSISSHATIVGQYLYGSSAISPNVGTSSSNASIAVYDANNWLGGGFLYSNTPSVLPLVETNPIQNHSWIGSTGNVTIDTEILRRFDYMLRRDNVLATVGVNNGSGNSLPALLAQSHNALAVGLSNGDHSSGVTSLDGSGRTKPDIVVPVSATSWATPTVAAAGALLLQSARESSTPVHASKSEVLRSILLAGASKEESEFSTAWTNSESSPLDARYGAGELDVETSYGILSGGEFNSSNASVTADRGWDFGTSSIGSPQYYFIDLPEGTTAFSLTASLVWNSIVEATDTNPSPFATSYSFSTIVPNLDLRLYSATGFVVEGQIAASLSPSDNLELIYAKSLSSGRYALSVTSDTAAIDYGLAWTASVPEPASVFLLLAATGFLWFVRTPRKRS